jgi:hypothetical protein
VSEVERTTDGTINNCALANFDDEKNCQVCGGTCPDREQFNKAEYRKAWLENSSWRWSDEFGLDRPSKVVDDRISHEARTLIKRGNVTPEEVASLKCNSWEWEALVPAMNDEAFVARVEHALHNSSIHRRPFITYDAAVVGLYAPELLKRFKRSMQTVEDFAESIDAIREAISICDLDGGCRVKKALEAIRERGKL